jgi:hypothetical protein
MLFGSACSGAATLRDASRPAIRPDRLPNSWAGHARPPKSTPPRFPPSNSANGPKDCPVGLPTYTVYSRVRVP